MHAHHTRFDSALFRTARSGWKAAWLGLAIAASALLGGCGGGGHDDVDDGSGVATPPPSVSATIGAGGGTLVGPDDVRIEIPAGALSAPTTITVTKTAVGAPALPASAASAKSPAIYELTPHGLHFDVPVAISMPSTSDPAIDPVLMAQPGGDWEIVHSAAEGGRVSWSTTHFSWTYHYQCSASYPPGTPLPPNGPPGCHFPSSGVQVSAVPSTALVSTVPDGYRVDAAADVIVRFRYSAPLDCLNPVITTWRFKRPAIAPTQVSTTAVVLTLTPSPRIPGAVDLLGSTDVPFHFDHTDNGIHEAGFFFACQGTLTAGGVLQFAVQAPQPPPAPAAPLITQQPVDVTVAVGATAGFDVLATAADSLVVRWQRKEPGGTAFAVVPGAAPITGGSRVSLVATASDTGASYRAQVCNARDGQETCTLSSPATLTVTGAPPPPTTVLPPGGMLSGTRASSCAIASDRRLRCWGSNANRGLGTGFADATIATPTTVLDLFDVTYVSEGLDIGCAVFDGGRSRCWGRFGSYGSGSPGPVALDGSTDAVKVYAGDLTVCIVRTDAHAYCNYFAGPMTADGRVIDGVVDVVRLDQNFCALDVTGVLRCVAYDGNLGASVLVESGVASLSRAAVDAPVLCGVLANGIVTCWGSDAFGQFGRGAANLVDTSGSPIGVTGAVAVAVGARHACALRGDGRVLCWGSGFMGNGQGAQSAAAPTLVQGLADVRSISAGTDFTCALRSDGQVMCWGLNDSGQAGIGSVGGPVLVPTPTFAGAVFVH